MDGTLLRMNALVGHLSLAVALLVLPSSSRAQEVAGTSLKYVAELDSRHWIIKPPSGCWAPRPEEVPVECLREVAARLVREDRAVLADGAAGTEEARRLRAVWTGASAKVRSALEESVVTQAIDELASRLQDHLAARLHSRRIGAAETFWTHYRDAYEAAYVRFYRRKMKELGECRPLSSDEEPPLLKSAEDEARTRAVAYLRHIAPPDPENVSATALQTLSYRKIGQPIESSHESCGEDDVTFSEEGRRARAHARASLRAALEAAPTRPYFGKELIDRLSKAYAMAVSSDYGMSFAGCGVGAAAGSDFGTKSIEHWSGLPKLPRLRQWTRHMLLDEKLGFRPGAPLKAHFDQVMRACARAGLEARVYHVGTGGLAIVTEPEWISDDGRPKSGRDRFNLDGVQAEGSGLLASFLGVRTGRYRLFVFFIGKREQLLHEGTLTWNEAKELYSGGSIDPNPSYLDTSTDGLVSSALIYEFHRKNENSDPEFVPQSQLIARDHIVGARLWSVNDLAGPIQIAQLVSFEESVQ